VLAVSRALRDPAGVWGAGAAPAAASAQETACQFPITETDATGTAVTVDSAPERVVTAGPSAAQTMWEIGGKPQVVGVSKYASYLEGAAERRNVSGGGRSYVSVEQVVAAEPDLVLAPNIIVNDTVERLREANLTVFRFGYASSIEDIYAKTDLTGRLTGNCEGAAETLTWMRDRIGTVRDAVTEEPRPRVFASQGGGWTAGAGTFVSSLVEVAGGSNVAVAANLSGYKQISQEVIVERNPEWIVQLGQFGTYPKTEAYNSTEAVENEQVITVDGNFVSQPAPQVVYPVVEMAQAFHPEAYEAANESPATTTADAGPTEGAPGTETSAPGTPGFGVAVALAALAGAALLGRRP
jgi:iron complex transport system substrate-binding protein